MGEEQTSQRSLQIPFPESIGNKYRIQANKQNKRKIDLKIGPEDKIEKMEEIVSN